MRLSWTLALLLACSGGGGDDTGPLIAVAPTIAGRYQVFVSSVSGCDNDPSWVQDWAEGPMLVTGEGDSVTFDFYEGVVFSGRVGDDNTYVFSGIFTHKGAELDLYHQGDLTLSGEVTELTGRFEIEVNDDEFDDNNCTLVSDMKATEVVGSD